MTLLTMTQIWLLVLLVVLVLAVVAIVIRGLRKKGAPPFSAEALQEASDTLAKVKADIQEFGWHLCLVQGEENEPSFLYTIGLWKTYQHPEILLFSPGRDPRGVAASFDALVKRVIGGERLKSGQVYGKVFGGHDGAVRTVLPRWFASYLGTAGLAYGTFDFPAVQLYWPDREGHFPWQPGFDRLLFPRQPILYQDNVVLANVGYAEVQALIRQEGPKVLEESLADLFVELGDASREDLLEDWRWRVGPRAELFQVTIFGDLFVTTPDGHIHWLDTGADFYQDAAVDRESWLRLLCDRPALFFHTSTLLLLRDLDYRPEKGYLYSWRLPPLLGGEESANNVGSRPLNACLIASGQTARQVEAHRQKPPETKTP